MLAKIKLMMIVLMCGLFISTFSAAQTNIHNDTNEQADTNALGTSAITTPASALEKTAAPQDAATTNNFSQPLETSNIGDQHLPRDLSPWGMFMAADMVVKAVMIGLALASLLTWTIWLAKLFELSGAKRRLKRVYKIIGHSKSLDEAVSALKGETGYAAALAYAAYDEVEMAQPALEAAGSEGLKERVGSRLSRIEVAAGRKLSRGTGILATIGSIAPFVGLFGTVWGIMNSFINISEAQTTNLAVVAPGIAEALLATALGLVAAIPAVMIYNMFARSITVYRQSLTDVSAAIERLISRDDDFQRAGLRAKAVNGLKAAE